MMNSLIDAPNIYKGLDEQVDAWEDLGFRNNRRFPVFAINAH